MYERRINTTRIHNNDGISRADQWRDGNRKKKLKNCLTFVHTYTQCIIYTHEQTILRGIFRFRWRIKIISQFYLPQRFTFRYILLHQKLSPYLSTIIAVFECASSVKFLFIICYIWLNISRVNITLDKKSSNNNSS